MKTSRAHAIALLLTALAALVVTCGCAPTEPTQTVDAEPEGPEPVHGVVIKSATMRAFLGERVDEGVIPASTPSEGSVPAAAPEQISRLLDIHKAILAGESAPMGGGVSIRADRAEMVGEGDLALRQVVFELADGSSTPVVPLIHLVATDAGLAGVIGPTSDTPWETTVAAFNAFSSAGFDEIGFAPEPKTNE